MAKTKRRAYRIVSRIGRLEVHEQALGGYWVYDPTAQQDMTIRLSSQENAEWQARDMQGLPQPDEE